MFTFKIITKKKLNSIIAEHDELEKKLQDIRGQHIALHQLYKGLVNKATYEMGAKEDEIRLLSDEVKKLKAENNRLRNSLQKASKH